MNTTPNRPPFDSNRAWSEATDLVSANREILLALGGVFLVLPAFAIAMLMPTPQLQEQATFEAVLATLGEFYRAHAIVLAAVALFQMIGSLTILALFTDTRRPTVGEAIRLGFRYTPTAIAAQLILGAAVGAMVLLPVLLGGAAKSPGITVFSLLAALGLGLWAIVRLSLVAPAVIVDRMANPLGAMRRSWQLTEGNVWRLLAFFILVVIGFAVVTLVGEGMVRLILTLLAGDKPADIVATLVATLLQATMSVYLVAISAACHRQLEGPSPQSVVDKFD